MHRTYRLMSTAAAAVLVGGLALFSPASAVPTPPKDGVGTVSCSKVSGSLKFSPALTYPGTQPTTITFTTVLNGCSGTGDGANVRSGKSVQTINAPTNDCLSLLNAAGQPRSGTLKWMAKPYTHALTASTVDLTSGSGTQGPPITVDTNGSVSAGSFTGDTVTAHTIVKETLALLTAKCTSVKGLAAIHFATGSTASFDALG